MAKSPGAIGLTLSTASDNAVAQALYERMGWQRDNSFLTYDLYLNQFDPLLPLDRASIVHCYAEIGRHAPACLVLSR